MIQLHVIKTKMGGNYKKCCFFPQQQYQTPSPAPNWRLLVSHSCWTGTLCLVMGALARQHPVPPDTPSSVPTPQNLPCLMPPMTLCPRGPSRFLPVCPSAAAAPPALEMGSASFASSIMVLYWAELPPEPPFSHRYGSGPARPPPTPFLISEEERGAGAGRL